MSNNMKEYKHKITPKENAIEKDIEDRERRKAISMGDNEAFISNN